MNSIGDKLPHSVSIRMFGCSMFGEVLPAAMFEDVRCSGAVLADMFPMFEVRSFISLISNRFEECSSKSR